MELIESCTLKEFNSDSSEAHGFEVYACCNLVPGRLICGHNTMGPDVFHS